MPKRPASARDALSSSAASAALAIVLALICPSSGRAQQVPDLVTPDTLRVCADPANMPFSSRKGEGFENRIAEIIADELKIPVRHYWLPQGPGFVRNTLGMKLCDVIIGYAAGTEVVQHSNPYYRSVYAVLVKQGGPLAGLKQLADPRLKGKRIGVVAATPPADHLAELGLIDQTKAYSLLVDRRYESPAEDMVADLLADRIDAAILWGPAGGYLAKRHRELEFIPLIGEKERPPLAYRITLGLRPNEIEWRRTLNTVLRRREADINKVLLEYGVPLLDEDDRLITGDESKP
jgi:quinoprotein dehydrogenase-associated probable ABC transporter substrate-binding protein